MSDFPVQNELFRTQITRVGIRGGRSLKTVIYVFCDFSFSVTNKLVHPFLDGFTLEEALARKKLFIVDYKTADGVYSKEGFQVRVSGFLVE